MVAILKTKAEKQHSLEISDEVSFFIASIVNDKPNIRELEGMLTRLIAESSLDGSEISLDFARNALKNFIRDKDHPESIENIQKTVAKYFKLKVSDLKSQKRLKAVAEPRQNMTTTQLNVLRLTKSTGPQAHKEYLRSFQTTALIEYHLKQPQEYTQRLDFAKDVKHCCRDRKKPPANPMEELAGEHVI